MRFSFSVKRHLSLIIVWILAFGPVLTHSMRAYAEGEPEQTPITTSLNFSSEVETPPSEVDFAAGHAENFILELEKGSRHPLDEFRLLEQEVVEHSQKVKWDNIGYKVLDKNGIVLKNGYFRDRNNLNHTFDIIHEFAKDADRLILTYRDQDIHKLAMTPRTIGFFDRYLVFYETEGFVGDQSIANLSFVDLEEFNQSVGNERLPVFRIPVKAKRSDIVLSKNAEGNLEVNSDDGLKLTTLSPKLFETFSQIQTMGFYMMANLVGASQGEGSKAKTAYEETKHLAAQFTLLFDQLLKLAGEDKVQQLSNAADIREEVMVRMEGMIQRQMTPQQIEEAAAEDTAEKLQGEIFSKHAKHRQLQQKLMSRVKAMFQRLTLPAPKTAQVAIHNALYNATAALLRINYDEGALKESILQIANNRKMQISAVLLAAAAGVVDPDIGAFYYQGMEVISSVFEIMFGKACDLGFLVKKSTLSTLSGLNPFVVHDAYISDGKIFKLATGLTAAFTAIGITLGVPHVITNVASLVKDLNRSRPKLPKLSGWLHYLKSLPQRILVRQDNVQDEYLRNLGESDVKNAGSDKTKFTPEQNARIEDIVSELRKSQESLVSRVKSSVVGNTVKKSDYRIRTYAQALRHFFFSACSFTISGYTYASAWNYWFMFRSMVLKPIYTGMYLYYPNYFRTVTNSINGRSLVPSAYNGGLRPWYTHEWMRLQQLFGDNQLPTIEAFEKKLNPIEEQVERIALRRALAATIKEIKNLDDIEKLIEKGRAPSHINDTLYQGFSLSRALGIKPGAISRSTSVYFQNYYNRCKDAIMNSVLSVLASQSENPRVSDPMSLTPDQMKYQLGTELDKLEQFDEARLEEIATFMEDSENIAYKSRSTVQSWWEAAKEWGKRYNVNSASGLDISRNRQIERFQSVRRQLDNPQALARAVRSTIASIIVDKPLEIAMQLVLLAGITEGLNKPLYEEMFSENSWFYLGRYPFFTGYIVGIVMQTLSDIWMKLQQDEQNEGSFGDRPDSEFRDKPFRSWYLKKFFAPENGFWKNQMHYIKIIWSNMPAALVTFLVTNLLTLGRLDLDMYILGYLFCYFVPTSGLAFKIEQAYELAAGYFKKDIPEEFDAHPLTQEYLMQRTAKARLWFNFYYKSYENVLGFLMGNLMTISSAELGPRSLTRWIFGGYTPTELVANAAQSIKNNAGMVPGVTALMDGCQWLFTNNYTDGEKFMNGIIEKKID